MMTRLQLETRQHALISDSRDNEIYELGVRHGLELASLKRCPTHGTEHTGECPKCAEKAAFRKEQSRKAKEWRKDGV